MQPIFCFVSYRFECRRVCRLKWTIPLIFSAIGIRTYNLHLVLVLLILFYNNLFFILFLFCCRIFFVSDMSVNVTSCIFLENTKKTTVNIYISKPAVFYLSLLILFFFTLLLRIPAHLFFFCQTRFNHLTLHFSHFYIEFRV